MKAVVISFLLLGSTLSASAMGHPHNLFSAHRKAQHYKTVSSKTTTPTPNVTSYQLTTSFDAAGQSLLVQGWAILRKKFL